MPKNNHPEFIKKMIEQRKQPGYCRHCGRKKDAGETTVICGMCLEKQRQRAKAIRLKKQNLSSVLCQESFDRLVESVNVLKVRTDNLLRRVRGEYKRGHKAGKVAAMRKAIQEAQKQAQKPIQEEWASWEQELDMDEKKRQFHRFAAACGGTP